MYYIIYTLFISLFFSINSEIIGVFEHFRNGARVPGYFIDEYPEGEYWDMFKVHWYNTGELTEIGLRMQYILGYQNRVKYKSILSEMYDPTQILIFSTDRYRTIYSAQAHIQGMFPAGTGRKIDPWQIKASEPPMPITPLMQKEVVNLGLNVLPENVQIVPIHIFKKDSIEHLINLDITCDKLKENIKKSKVNEHLNEFYKKLNNTYGEQLMEMFNENSTKFLFNFDKVFKFTAEFLTDYVNNRNLTILKKYGIDIKEFYDLCMEFKLIFLFEKKFNELVAQYSASPNFRFILNWMEKKIKLNQKKEVFNHYDDPKMVVYSGSDLTMAPFELFMKTAFGTPLIYPLFASNIVFEVHKKDNVEKPTYNDYHIEYYINGELHLNVSFNVFKYIIEKTLISDQEINRFCYPQLEKNEGFMIVAVIIAIVFVIILIGRFFCYKTKKSYRKRNNPELKRYDSLA